MCATCVSSFSCAVTVTCHSDCVRAFVAVNYQWQCVGKCLFVSVYQFWLVVAALVFLWKPVIKTWGSEHVRSLRGSTASLQVGVCVPSEVELKCPCVNPISSVQQLTVVQCARKPQFTTVAKENNNSALPVDLIIECSCLNCGMLKWWGTVL